MEEKKPRFTIKTSTILLIVLILIIISVVTVRRSVTDVRSRAVTTGEVTPTPTGKLCPCPSPTPIYQKSSCNGPCMGSENCPDNHICIFIFGSGWVCRNPSCYIEPSCSCSTQ